MRPGQSGVAQRRDQGAEQQRAGDAGQAAADHRDRERGQLRHDPGLGVAERRGGVDLSEVQAAQPPPQPLRRVDLQQRVAQDLGDHVAAAGQREEQQRHRQAAGQPEADDRRAPQQACPDHHQARPPDPAGPAAGRRPGHRAGRRRCREQAERRRAAVKVLGGQRREQPGGHAEQHRAGVDQQHAAEHPIVPHVPEALGQRAEPRPLHAHRGRQRPYEQQRRGGQYEAPGVDAVAGGQAGTGDQQAGQRRAAQVAELAAHPVQGRGGRQPRRPDQRWGRGRGRGRTDAAEQPGRERDRVDGPHRRVRRHAVHQQRHGQRGLRQLGSQQQRSAVIAVREHPAGQQADQHADAGGEAEQADRERRVRQRVDLPAGRGRGDHAPGLRGEPPGVQPAEVTAFPQRRHIDDDLPDAHAAPLLLPVCAGDDELPRTTQVQSPERLVPGPVSPRQGRTGAPPRPRRGAWRCRHPRSGRHAEPGRPEGSAAPRRCGRPPGRGPRLRGR